MSVIWINERPLDTIIIIIINFTKIEVLENGLAVILFINYE